MSAENITSLIKYLSRLSHYPTAILAGVVAGFITYIKTNNMLESLGTVFIVIGLIAFAIAGIDYLFTTTTYYWKRFIRQIIDSMLLVTIGIICRSNTFENNILTATTLIILVTLIHRLLQKFLH